MVLYIIHVTKTIYNLQWCQCSKQFLNPQIIKPANPKHCLNPPTQYGWYIYIYTDEFTIWAKQRIPCRAAILDSYLPENDPMEGHWRPRGNRDAAGHTALSQKGWFNQQQMVGPTRLDKLMDQNRRFSRIWKPGITVLYTQFLVYWNCNLPD